MKHLEARPWQSWLACASLLWACNRAPANPADDALHVIQRWAAAFSESNVDAIVSLYAPDATFFGTGSKALVTSPDQIRSYFDAALNRDKPRGAELLERWVQVVSDDVVIVTGKDRVSGTKDGQLHSSEGRVTFVLEKRGTGWQIVHFHRSALPS